MWQTCRLEIIFNSQADDNQQRQHQDRIKNLAVIFRIHIPLVRPEQQPRLTDKVRQSGRFQCDSKPEDNFHVVVDRPQTYQFENPNKKLIINRLRPV